MKIKPHELKNYYSLSENELDLINSDTKTDKSRFQMAALPSGERFYFWLNIRQFAIISHIRMSKNKSLIY